MTITDQIKILNKKIMQNEAQQNLDRKAAKISALSSNNLDKNEYLTGENLGLKPSNIEQGRFEYSPLGKYLNKGLDKDVQKEGLFKKLKNIEDSQKGLINGNNKNKPDSILSKSEHEDEDENENTARWLYQDGTEGIKGLKLPGGIERKHEKSQIYLENNLNKIKNNFLDIYDKYQRLFKYIANKEKHNIDYEILSSKVDDINFYDRYNVLYNYLNYFFKFSVEEISIKNKPFLKNRKGLNLKVSILPRVKII